MALIVPVSYRPLFSESYVIEVGRYRLCRYRHDIDLTQTIYNIDILNCSHLWLILIYFTITCKVINDASVIP